MNLFIYIIHKIKGRKIYQTNILSIFKYLISLKLIKLVDIMLKSLKRISFMTNIKYTKNLDILQPKINSNTSIMNVIFMYKRRGGNHQSIILFDIYIELIFGSCQNMYHTYKYE